MSDILQAADLPPPDAALCAELEHWETPVWAARAILRHEVLTRCVIDPCTGTGVLAEAARDAGYIVTTIDIHDWGYPLDLLTDFLALEKALRMVGSTCFMNPPFTKAVEFVEKAFELGARKVVCFQRFAW